VDTGLGGARSEQDDQKEKRSSHGLNPRAGSSGISPDGEAFYHDQSVQLLILSRMVVLSSGRRSSPRALLALCAFLTVVTGCSIETEAPVAEPRPRLVSLVPPATHLLVRLGAGSALAGADARSLQEARLEGVAEMDLESAIEARPHLLIVGPDDALPAGGLPADVRPVVFEPHDLQDVAAFVRDVGDAVLGWEAVTRWESEYFRPLSRLSENVRLPRPRVVAVVSMDPLVIAGGHSFETDLIQYAGGDSVTHDGELPRREVGVATFARLAPDLVLVVAEPPEDPEHAATVRDAIPGDAPVVFFPIDPDFWLVSPETTAARLQAIVTARSRALSAARDD
jgi:ABC-type Fe3+-hydroxamate transport system substrate-binding protein